MHDVDALEREINSGYGTDAVHRLVAECVAESQWLKDLIDDVIKAERRRVVKALNDEADRYDPEIEPIGRGDHMAAVIIRGLIDRVVPSEDPMCVCGDTLSGHGTTDNHNFVDAAWYYRQDPTN